MSRKLPIGIQGFEKLRTGGFLYVDKTEYIYQLAHDNVPYFLSRPRRFGKSLLLSTMKAYWEGKKELFQGLAIESLEKGNPDAWKTWPIFYFDFNGANYHEKEALEGILDEQLRRWEQDYNLQIRNESLGERFRNLLISAHRDTGLRCIVLVDEYDKPLLDTMDDKELQEHNKDVFKGFFSTLKSFDEYIRFVFITGVSRFHKVSIFSDLNQLKDISLTKKYAALCGLTEEELRACFQPEIQKLAEEQGMTEPECLAALKQTYDGYHFHPNGPGVYNPYSLLNAFSDGEFGSYWFETGTPTFLVKKLRETEFDVRKFTDRTLYASEGMLKDYSGDSQDPVPLLYQTGYLTIAGFERTGRVYTLAFPNEEVKYGFVECLMPEYIADSGAGSGKDIFTLRRYVEQGELEKIRDVLTALFAGITCTLETDPFEHYFQAVIYLVFTLLGKFALCEMHTCTGRIDCKVETTNFVYQFEFKRDDTAQAALEQIDSKDYALPFTADSRKLYKIGVSFDSATRKLAGWAVKK
ncbi:MAG: AAA family ATPase [Blautia sp.]|nr:AAA family ATPase [Blautia sp.]